MTSDLELLQSYQRDGSEESFAALVNRHLNLVYSAAVRQVRSPQLAEEVAQSVFADLARKAPSLTPDTILAAWLYQVTRRTAIDVVRSEARRQLREQIAMEMKSMNDSTANWSQIEPLLDEAMQALDDCDRTAILLRYFENKSLREVGDCMGTTDDTAQKRVSRAIDRLRAFFTKRGVTIGAGSLTVVISGNAVQAAPVALFASISTTTAIAGATAASAKTITAAKVIAMTTLQKASIAAVIVAAAATCIYEARKASHFQLETKTLQQQQAPLTNQIAQLLEENEAAARKLAVLRQENEQLGQNTAQLPKLRGEITRMRGDLKQLAESGAAANDSFVQQALKWKANEARLRQLFDDQPNQRVPEMELLSDDAWLSIARYEDLDSEAGIRKALSEVRWRAKNIFVNQLSDALAKYVGENDGRLPGKVLDLKSSFEESVSDEMLEQYKLLYTDKTSDVPRGKWTITDKQVIDKEYDMPWGIGPGGFGPMAPSQEALDLLRGRLDPVLQEFANEHDGKSPDKLSQLIPYLKNGFQSNALERLDQFKERIASR